MGTSINAFRPELTIEGRSSPIFRFGDDEATSAQIWQNLPELFWYLEAPRKKPAALVLAEHPTQTGTDGKLPIFLYQFVGAGKSMFNAVDDTWRWRLPGRRPLFRPVLDPDDPVPGAFEVAGSAAGRGPDRSSPVSAEPADPGPGPVPEPRNRAHTGRGECPDRAERGASPDPGPETGLGESQPVRGGAAAASRRRLRGPPAPSAGARRPGPHRTIPGRAAGRRDGAHPR